MKVQKNIDIYLLKKHQKRTIEVVQYDTGVQLVFSILDFDLPEGATATIYVRKKSGNCVYQDCGVIVEDNTVIVDLDNQALTEIGECAYQIKLMKDDDVVSTFAGIMSVAPSLADVDAVESKTVISPFEKVTAEKIAEIEKAADENNLASSIVCEVEGTAIGISDASNRTLKGLTVYGKSEQYKTTGKNLLENIATTQTVSGVALTVNSDGSITANGTATANFSITLGKDIILPSGDYIVSGGKETNARIEFRAAKPDGSTTGGNDVGSGVNVTITDDVVSSKVTLVIKSGTVFNNYTFYPMIRLASIADSTYEPYTGGIASPSPDYPQEIVSVENPVVTINGKNLLDRRWLPSAPETYEHRGITFAPAENGKTSISGTTTGTFAQVPGTYFSNINLPAGAYKFKCFAEGTINNASVWCIINKDHSNMYTAVANAEAIDIEIVEGSLYRAFFCVKETGVTVDCKASAMIVASNVDTSTYEPYIEGQSLSVPYTLHGVGDVSDYVDFEKGVKVQRTYKLKVTDEYAVTNYSAIGSCARALITNAGYDVVDNTTPAFSNILPWVNSYSSDTPHFYATQNRVWVFVPIAELSTATSAGVKEWLIDHNAEFLYALATPIETPLTDEEMTAYKTLRTNYPNTTILVNDGAGVKLDYAADTKLYIDNKFAELSAAILGE